MTRLLRAAPILLAACAAAPRVPLGAAWPTSPLPYSAAHDRWTRRASEREDFVHLVNAAATLESPEWRAAYVHERARRLGIPPDQEARLLATEREAAAKAVEVEVLIATAQPEWNDLRKGKRSMWRLALVGDGGREVTPLEVREDSRPRAEIAAYFPDLGPFHEAYVVKFPTVAADGQPIVPPHARSVALKIAAPVASVELVWTGE